MSPSKVPSDPTMSEIVEEPGMAILSPATTTLTLCHLPTVDYLDYKPGGTMTVRVDPNENNEKFQQTIQVRVEKAIEPRTMSCGMLVQIEETGKAPRQAFLKVFDRRLSSHFREYFNGGECYRWTLGVEDQYMEALRQHGLPIGTSHYDTDNMTPEEWNKFSIPEKEHAFQQRMRKIHHDEREAYRRLVKHQGAEIPKLYASVCLGLQPPDTGSADTNENYGQLLEIRGLLLEYINGWELLSVPSNLFLRTATRLFEEALAVIRMIGTHGVLNYDVKLDNFMVTFDHRRGSHRVCMIDLGFCHFRHKSWSTTEWAKLKALAWDGEMKQICIEARQVVHRRFDAELNLDNKSSYGFLASNKPPRKCPSGWVQVQTSKGPAFVNPLEQTCKYSCCRPPRDLMGDVHRLWNRWTRRSSSTAQKRASTDTPKGSTRRNTCSY